MIRLDHCPAPAKLNLFLHVTGRRTDGYHLLQTAFRMLTLGDDLSFSLRDDGQIGLHPPIPGVPDEHNLVVRAARLLQQLSGTRLGADITLHKRLPMGGGLGGGSSDAATTLIALNRLWNTGMDRDTLLKASLSLGADVPFFIFGQDAFAEGVGEALQPIHLPPAHYVVVHPGIESPTAKIFSDEGLTRNTPLIRIADFAAHTTRNDLQATACRLFPEIEVAVRWLGQYAPSRMTGSGSCVFAEVDDPEEARKIVDTCPEHWRAWATQGIIRHPLHDWLS